MERLVIGIDISKASFTAAVWDGTKVIDLGAPSGYPTNDAAGYSILQTQLADWQQRTGSWQLHVILEVTGGYELGVVAFAHTQGWIVSLRGAPGPQNKCVTGLKAKANAPRTIDSMHKC